MSSGPTPARSGPATARPQFAGVRLPPPHHHRDAHGGALRPALFGAMDGLVSNGSLVAGVAGGGAATRTVALTALAGLVAGAFSMAVGEYASVRAQTEAVGAEVHLEQLELARAPESEEAELAALFAERGLSEQLALQVARQIHRDPDISLRVHTREELGVDIDNLPSPWTASLSSFAAFAAGALLPSLPWFAGAHLLWLSLLLAAVGLFAAGTAVGRRTRTAAWRSGTRQLLLGAAAAAITYAIGHVVGAGVV